MKKTLIILIILLVTFGCSQKVKLNKKIDKDLEKREYVSAIDNMEKLISVENNNEINIEKIDLLISEGRDYYKNSITIYENDSDLKKYDRILNSYENLNKINSFLLNLDISYRKKINYDVEDYDSEIEKIRYDAAKKYYDIANKKYQTAESKLEYRRASKLYDKVNNFIFGYEDSIFLQKLSKEKATMNVAILPIKDYRYYSQNMYLGDMIHYKALEWLLFDREIKEFTNIMTDLKLLSDDDYKKIENGDISILSDLKEKDMDLVVYSRLNAVFYEPSVLFTKVTPIKKSVFVNEKVWNRNKEKYDIIQVEKNVYSTKYEYSKKSSVKIVMSVKLINPLQNRIMDVDTLSHEVEDVVSWESYTGDERAYDTFSHDERYNRTKDDMLFECANKISEKYKNKISFFLK